MPTNYDQGPIGAPPVFDGGEMASQPHDTTPVVIEEDAFVKGEKLARIPQPRESDMKRGIGHALFDQGDIVD